MVARVSAVHDGRHPHDPRDDVDAEGARGHAGPVPHHAGVVPGIGVGGGVGHCAAQGRIKYCFTCTQVRIPSGLVEIRVEIKFFV